MIAENFYGASPTDYVIFKGYIESQIQDVIKQISTIAISLLNRHVRFLEESKNFSINKLTLAEECLFCLENDITLLEGFSKSDFQSLKQQSVLSAKTLNLLQRSFEEIAKTYNLDKYHNTQSVKKDS